MNPASPRIEPALKAKLRRAMALIDEVGKELSADDFLDVNEVSVLVQDVLYGWGVKEWGQLAAGLTQARGKLDQVLKRRGSR